MADESANNNEDSHWRALPQVFYPAAGIILAFVVAATVFTSQLEAQFSAVQSFIATYFGWFYILSVAFFLVFVLWLAFSRYGQIRLGANDSKPEFGRPTWFAMLFSAGMGIGLLFWSVAEPITHFTSPPTGEGGTPQAAIRALNLTYFHWGLHPWAIYSLVGMCLAYFSFRRGMPLTIRSAFYPLLGDRIYGPLGHIIDITAVVGTLFGVATSLGLGAAQINAGFHHVFGLPDNTAVQMVLIACITFIATISVVTGLHVGIRRLSEFNIAVAVLLCLFLFIVGPTVFILKLWVQSSGYYLQHLLETTLWTSTFSDPDWQAGWTIFYWGWWISWAPFVGMFIARISRGRTIREFVLGVLLVPTVVGFLWIAIFGGSAIYLELFTESSIAAAVEENVSVAMFQLFENFPFGAAASLAGTLIIITFFVTSSDSGSLVIDIITSGGDADPPVLTRIFWAVLEGVVAAILLYAGGLVALQTAAITTGLPFCAIMVLMAWSLTIALREELIWKAPPVRTEPEDYPSPDEYPTPDSS